jgi:hypothetical protein
MSRVILFMAMSLDGFVSGPGDDAQNPADINGMRLMDWLDHGSSGPIHSAPERLHNVVASRRR